MRKRVLSLLLAICLVVGLLPPTTLATTGETPSPQSVATESITLEMYFGNTNATTDPTTGATVEVSHLVKTAAPNKVYYFNTSADGLTVTDVTDAYTADNTTAWTIKLDNTKAVAELTLKSAYVKSTFSTYYSGTSGLTANANAMNVSGNGALKIIVDGAAGENGVGGVSTLWTKYADALTLAMGGTTTITSVNGGKLALTTDGSGNWVGLTSTGTGDVVLENANVVASIKTKSVYNHGRAINVATNLTVKGGTLEVKPGNVSGCGIWVTGELTVTDGAKVTVAKTSTGVYANSSVSSDKTVELYAVYAGSVKIGGGSLTITDTATYDAPGQTSTKNKTLKFYNNVINVVPDTTTLVKENDRVDIKVGNVADGSDAAAPSVELTADNIKTYRYISFTYVCGENNHDYGTDPNNPVCLKCGGGTREVPKDITVTLANVATWNAKAGEIYYATTTDKGVVTDLSTTAPADGNWNIKLDNSNAVAELTLKNATVSTTASSTSAMTVSGTGALKINVDGTSSLSAKDASAFTAAMEGGLTITSTNNGTLNITCTRTSIAYGLYSTGTGAVEFKDVNIIAKAHTKRNDAHVKVVSIASSLTVDGGSLTAIGTNSGLEGIYVAGTLTAKSFARVSVGTTYAGEFEGGSSTAVSSRVRHGINAGAIVIDTATVEVIDSNVTTTVASNDANFVFTGSFEKAFSVVPTVTNAVGKYSDSHEGTSAQEFDVTDAAAVTAILGKPYVVIEAICDPHVYDSNNPYDYDCNNCGYIDTTKPRDLTVHVVTDGGAKQTNPPSDTYDRNVTVPAGKIYYGIANADGLVTSFQEETSEPAEWAFMVDNTRHEAWLIFNNAKLTKTGADYKDADNAALSLLTVSGEGALKIIIRGNSTLTSSYGHVIRTEMAGGTTYTSDGAGKLTVEQNGTSGLYAITEGKGALTFDHANIDAYNQRFSQKEYARSPIVSAVSNMTVIGGKLNLIARDSAPRDTSAVHGISVGGKLTLSDYAIVTVKQTSTKADNYGVFDGSTPETYRTTYPRYGVKAAEIEINDASLYIIDTANKFEFATSVTPTLGANANVKAYTGNNIDGTDRAEFVLSTGAIESAYVAFVYDCNGQHTYDPNNQASDPDCDRCGEVRDVPRDLTVTFGNFVKDTVNQEIIWNVAPGQTYYATTNDQGVITDLMTTAPADGNWNIKLDNTKPVAELTLRNATLVKTGSSGFSATHNGIQVVGEGALKIIIDGNSTIQTGSKAPIVTGMAGGTTYTSINNGTLTVKQTATTSATAIVENAGNLLFDHANLYVTHNSENNQWPSSVISAARDMKVSGGKLELIATNYSIRGIDVAGNLTLEDYALVTIKQTSTSSKEFVGVSNRPGREQYRYGVFVEGEFIVDGANLYIIDNAKNMFEYTVNKIPTMITAKAYYSESIEGTNLQDLTAQNTVSLSNGPAAAVEFPYVVIRHDCMGVNNGHTYDPNNPEGDADCELCGFVRDVPRDVTITVRTDGGESAKADTEAVREYTVKANEVYYFVADDNGFITNVTTTEPDSWDMMLDNRNPVAQLVFDHDAYLYKKAAHGGSTLSISGEGALKIAINSNAKIKSGATNVITTSMAKGTTYTSVGDAKLTIEQDSTGLSNIITESAGNLIFDHANLYVTHRSENNQWPSSIISATYDMKIIGGLLDLIPINYSIQAIYVGGNLTLDDYAIVNIKQNSTSTKEFIGVTGRPGREQYRYGIHAVGEFAINNASLYINDNARNMFEYAINKLPVVTGNVKSYYSTSTDGSDLQTLTSANTTTLNSVATPVVEFPYVAFAYDCGGQHEYTNDNDPVCNKCGDVRIVPYPVTVTITNVVSKVLPDGKQIIWNAAVGQVYYATTDEQGVVTDLGTTNPGDGNWNIKLDNTKPVAELTFHNATLKKDGATGLARADAAIKIAGEGNLKIIIDGDSSVSTGYYNAILTEMKGGTTYTSVNGGKLTAAQNGTSGYSAIAETAGNLNFESAIIRATGKRQGKYKQTIVRGANDVNISGGSIEIEAINCSNNGLTAGGNLKLTNWAKVRLINQITNVSDYSAESQGPRYAVMANGVITIDESSLRIIDSIGHWDVAINKTPKLIGATAKYSEIGEGKDLKALNPADPAAAVEYPYVEYLVDCAEHIWDNEFDPECNRCGEIRAVPYDIQVAFQFGTATLGIVAWDVKVGEVYYAKTNANGQVIDLGKKDSEPADWNIKLDNTGAEAVLTLKEATIICKVRAGENDKVFGMAAGSFGGTIGAQGKGALRIVCEKASTITTDSTVEISTSMTGGTTYASKNNAKLTFNTTTSAVSTGIRETVGDLTFDHANLYVNMKRTSKNWTSNTVSTPGDMTVIGGRVEIVASAYACNGLNVKGDLLVKENGILIVTTGSSTTSGTCTRRPSGITVTGDITVDNATLMVKNYAKYWQYLINKMPILVGAASYQSENSTKESKLEAFTAEAGSDMTTIEAMKFFYFSNAKPGTLDDSAMEEEEEDDSFFFDDFDNPFTGDTVNLTLLFVLVMTSAAGLVVLFSKKRSFRE